MEQFRVKETSYVGERLVEAGAIVEVDTSIMTPGSNLEPVNAKPSAAEMPGPARVISAPVTANDPLVLVPTLTGDAARVQAQAAAVASGEAPETSLEAVKETSEQHRDAEAERAEAEKPKDGKKGAAR